MARVKRKSDRRNQDVRSSTRRILLAVAGLSPQVITETLYALAVARDPRWIPEEVHLITTSEGAERARLALLSEKPGWFRQLLQDYELPAVRFDEGQIHVLEDARGEPLADIRTPEDNERAGDFITAMVRNLTITATELHVSIAGGRKTLGYYLGSALSLFGRPQDRLSHVLVNEPFEASWEFFYPTPYSRIINTRDNKLADTKAAIVTLAEIPFVRFRNGFDQRLLEGSATFSHVVAAAQRALDPPTLQIDIDRKSIRAGGQDIDVPPAELAFLSWLARRAKTGRHEVECPTDGVPEEEYSQEYLREYANFGDGTESATARRLKRGMEKDFFMEKKSKLMRALRRGLGPDGARRYGIEDDGRRPRRYRIAVPADSIRWLGELE
jgi:CRISPR-associated protein (TIGR02584 family)